MPVLCFRYSLMLPYDKFDHISEKSAVLSFPGNFELPENDASWNDTENWTVKTLEQQSEIFRQHFNSEVKIKVFQLKWPD